MRATLAVVLIALAACSGGTPTTSSPPPPPPPTPGAPASLAIVAGDGQSAAAASVLPVQPAVLVKDAAGVAVPNVTVHFSVDSGGGSLAVTSATTGSNGVAMAGTWTLGAAAGVTNVVSASVAGLPTIRFHAHAFGVAARPIFTNLTVGTGGGTFRYTKAGDALDGLTLTVPAAAYHAAVQWTITADSSITVPLPAGFSQAGPVLVITNGQGYADSTMTLTVPLHLAAGMVAAPFYFDPVSGTLEGIPLVASTSTAATLATLHFSGDLMAIPGSGAKLSMLRSSIRAGFGSVRVVWIQLPGASLAGTYTTTFHPGVDDWEFINYGDFLSPGGDCEGMSITAMYYHYYFRLGPTPRAGLFHQFDLSLLNQWDDIQGIRFAGSVQLDYLQRYHAGVDQVASQTAVAKANGLVGTSMTSDWILLTLKLTGRPVLMGLKGPTGGHAVVAYAATSDGSNTTVSFSDPNYPGTTTRTMTFVNGILDPVNLALNAAESPDYFSMAYALGVSAEVPLTEVTARWQQFIAGTAGSDNYPKDYHFEVFEPLTGTWSTLGSVFQTTQNTLKIRAICNDCQFAAGSAPWEEPAQIWDAVGQTVIGPVGFRDNITTTTPFMAVALALGNDYPHRAGYLDAQAFTFVHGSFFVTASDATPSIGVAVNFVNHHGGLAITGSQWKWDFKDGTPTVTATNDSLISHAFTAPGTFDVAVTLVNAGVPKGTATVTITVQATQSVSITPIPLAANPGIAATLNATTPGAFPPQAHYDWTFGDGFAGTSIQGSSHVQHTWNNVGSFPVSVTVFDSARTFRLGQSTASMCVGTAWRISTFTFVGGTLPGTHPPPPDDYVAASAALYTILDRIAAIPSDGLFYLGDGTYFPEQGVYLQVAPPGTGGSGGCWLFGGYVIQAARTLGVNSNYFNTGSPTLGSVDGQAAAALTTLPYTAWNLFNNTFHGSKVGTQMTGTVTFGSTTWGGSRTYNYTAVLVGQ